jgi:hypothetical protein
LCDEFAEAQTFVQLAHHLRQSAYSRIAGYEESMMPSGSQWIKEGERTVKAPTKLAGCTMDGGKKPKLKFWFEWFLPPLAIYALGAHCIIQRRVSSPRASPIGILPRDSQRRKQQ